MPITLAEDQATQVEKLAADKVAAMTAADAAVITTDVLALTTNQVDSLTVDGALAPTSLDANDPEDSIASTDTAQFTPDPPLLPALTWPLPHNCLTEMGQSNMSWNVVAHPGTVPEQYHLNPMVFKNIAAQFNLFDKVQMLASDATWWADFLVVEMGSDAASLHLLQSVYLDTSEDRQDVIPGFQIRRAQPGDGQSGWIVINREVGSTLNLNQPLLSYDAAVHFLRHSSAVHPKHRSSGLVG